MFAWGDLSNWGVMLDPEELITLDLWLNVQHPSPRDSLAIYILGLRSIQSEPK